MDINISVRNLVEFVLRSGDIDSTYIGQKRAVEGTKAHQKIQRIRKQEANLNDFIYKSEFSLKYSVLHKGFNFNIEGRADGILITDKDICVEEIKSTYMDLDSLIFDKNHWHLAQAKSYAYMYSKLYNAERIKILLTYYNIETDTSITFEEIFSENELDDFFANILDKYYVFAKMDMKRIAKRNETGNNLLFPYKEYRKGQRKLAVAVYKTIKLSKKLFVQAPTGIGKTISTIFPSIKAIAKGEGEKIFYLTAKTITRQVAENAFDIMTSQGLELRTVTLTAKEKICINEKVSCNPIDCKCAKGHFDRVNGAIIDIIENELVIKRETIEKYALKYNICPYEYAFDILDFCDCIICDYNYVYDPKVYLKKYFAEGMKNKFIILNDESHNLVDRAREMFSASINQEDIKKVKSKFTKSKLKTSLNKINDFIKDIDFNILQNYNNAVLDNVDKDFIYLLYEFIRLADIWLMENKSDKRHELVLELYFKVTDFLRINDYFDDKYVFFIEKNKKDIELKLLCLDCSKLLADILERIDSSIFFSATLSPIWYFKKVLGADEEDFHIIIDSLFEQKNLALIIDSGISTKYINRDKSYEKIAGRLNIMVTSKKGNYIVFFPSYKYLEKVYEVFANNFKEIKTLVQNKNLTEEEREEFLNNFTEGNNILGFAVLGGVFSEGIDLTGEKLIGVCVVSVGLPLISAERNIISDYYRKINANGFDYAYKFPGINKVLQASGRVIRTETDKGVVLLIDDRFISNEYKILYPNNWSHYINISTERALMKTLWDFWK